MPITPMTQLPQREERAKRIPLPENSPFQFWVDEGRTKLVGDEFRYHPVSVPFKPGVQGVSDSDTGPMKTYQEDKLRRVLVPMDFDVTAWGEPVTGYMIRKDVGQDRLGKQLWHYHDVWTRHIPVGSSLILEYDQAGFDDFCKRAEALVGRPPHPQVAKAEAARMKKSAQTHRRIAHQSPGAELAASRIDAALEATKTKTTKTTTRGAAKGKK